VHVLFKSIDYIFDIDNTSQYKLRRDRDSYFTANSKMEW